MKKKITAFLAVIIVGTAMTAIFSGCNSNSSESSESLPAISSESSESSENLDESSDSLNESSESLDESSDESSEKSYSKSNDTDYSKSYNNTYDDNDDEGFYCMGKNDTCPNKTSDAYDFYCHSCDPDNNNIEGDQSKSNSDGVIGDNNYDGYIDEDDWEDEWNAYLDEKLDEYDDYGYYGW